MKDDITKWILQLVNNVFLETVSMQEIKDLFQKNNVIEIIRKFIVNEGPSSLIFHRDKQGNLQLQTNILSLVKSSNDDSICLYITKKDDLFCSPPEAIPFNSFPELYHGIFICSHDHILSHLKMMTEDIILTFILQLERNAQISKDMMNHALSSINGFSSDLYLMKGQIVESKAILPLPPSVLISGHEINDLIMTMANTEKTMYMKDNLSEHIDEINADLPQHIEKYMSTWTKQINRVLQVSVNDIYGSSSLEFKQPTPGAVLDFWSCNKSEFSNLFNQLQSNRVRQVLKFLDEWKSKYNASFAKLCKELFWARNEANSNYKFLMPMRLYSDKLTADCELSTLSQQIQPIFHLLLLIWKTSVYFNTKSCLVDMFENLSNIILEQAYRHLTDSMLVNLMKTKQCAKAIDKINEIIKLFGAFKAVYFLYKKKSSDECSKNSWKEIDDSCALRNMESSLNRCHEVIELLRSDVEYSSCQDVIFRGYSGQILTSSTRHIYADFKKKFDGFFHLHHIKGVSLMKVESEGLFEDYFYSFRRFIVKLDSRLVRIISFGMHECHTLSQKLSLLRGLGTLLKRAYIKHAILAQHEPLTHLLLMDIQDMDIEFEKMKDNHSMRTNNSLFSLDLMHKQALLKRVDLPITILKDMDSRLLGDRSGQALVRSFTSLQGKVVEFERKCIDEITNIISNFKPDEWIRRPLLLCSSTNYDTKYDCHQHFLQINTGTDFQLVHKVIKLFNVLNVKLPQSSDNIPAFIRSKWPNLQNLQMFCHLYNETIGQSQIIKLLLSKLEHQVTSSMLTSSMCCRYCDKQPDVKIDWCSDGLENFINDCMRGIKTISNATNMLNRNIAEIQSLIFCKHPPLFKRPLKTCSASNFASFFDKNVGSVTAEIQRCAHQVEKLMEDIFETLPLSNEIKISFLNYLDMKMIMALEEYVVASLEEFELNLNEVYISEKSISPMIEIRLHLVEKQVFFDFLGHRTNSIDSVLRKFIRQKINRLVGIGNEVLRFHAKTFQRSGTYIQDLLTSPKILCLISKIEHDIDTIGAKIDQYQQKVWNFEELWRRDQKKFFYRFIEDTSSTKEHKKFTHLDHRQSKMLLLSLEDVTKLDLMSFDKTIKEHMESLHKLFSIPSNATFGFIQINIEPFKHILESELAKATNLYTSYLQAKIFQLSMEMQKFFDEIKKCVEKQSELIQLKDEKTRYYVEETINVVESNMDNIPNAIIQLKNILDVLHSNDIQCECIRIRKSSIGQFLKEAPGEWNGILTNSFRAKEILASRSYGGK